MHNTPLHIRFILLFIAFAAPIHVMSTPAPYKQKFMITAYYSPEPHQCCYVKGGERADKILNGEGHTAADGTPVYPGMIAAPPSYPFGTKVELPGLGIFTVNDRGGAIQEQGDVHRLDIWIGHGEEGLARALNFGVEHIEGTIYPVGGLQPATHFVFETIPATVHRLQNYLIDKSNLIALRPKAGDNNLSVRILQEYLTDAGYLDHEITGFFGAVTQTAMQTFLSDFGLSDSAISLSEKSAAYLVAAVQRKGARDPISGYIDRNSSHKTLTEAQRTLRYLGYYKGRTDGQYSDTLFHAILHFQQDHALVGTVDDPGAGQIGPITMKKLNHRWNSMLVSNRANSLLLMQKVETLLAQRGERIEQFMGEGYSGAQVRLLQQMLADRGFFPEEKINGNFGELTKESVMKYQITRGIIANRFDEGAGYVGPTTMTALRDEQRRDAYQTVRGQGINVL